jgi:hypothetical protein
MLANPRIALFTGSLSIGIAALGCSAQPGAPHLVHATAEIVGGPSAVSSGTANTAAIKPMLAPPPQASGVQIVELNGAYQGCVEMSGAWSVAVNGSNVDLDNPPLTVVEADGNCQLVITSVRANQLYVASSPLLAGGEPQQSSSFTAASEDGGTPQVAFYANAVNTDPGYFGDFTLILFYSPEPNQTSTGTTATYTTNSASPAEIDQLPTPNYSVDLSQMTIQTDANNVVTSASGQASFAFNSISGSGYVVDDGTLHDDPTFGQLDALYTSQTPTPIPWDGSFAIDASALSIQGTQLPAVRSVVIGSDSMNGVSAYQNVTIAIAAADDSTPNGEKRAQMVVRLPKLSHKP